VWIAEALRERGAEVGVVTGAPHYPSGRVLDGYRARGWIRETQHGFTVVRVPEYPSHDTSALRRIATFGSFALSATALATRTIGAADVALVYSSPATSALPALAAHSLNGTPYVLLVQDLWPDSVFASGMVGDGTITRAMRGVLEAFVARTYREAAHIAVIAPGMRERLVERGVPAEKVTVVHNWVDESVLRPVAPNGRLRALLGLGADEVLVVHAGNQGEAQALGHWVAAMARLGDLPHLHLVLLGAGTQHDSLRRQVTALGLQHQVHLPAPVRLSEVAEHTSDADALAVSLREDPLFAITLPSKTQAALAQGKPVVVSAPGDAARVVTAAGAGWVARPDDEESIARALRAVAEAPAEDRRRRGEAGLAHYRGHMSATVGGDALAGILRRAAGRA
jgi:glycosyltransferase involved in cell wall biosynthesis